MTTGVLRASLQVVMAGLLPAIHVVGVPENDVDARDGPGHDGVTNWQDCSSQQRHTFICDRPAACGERGRAAAAMSFVLMSIAEKLHWGTTTQPDLALKRS
ncbi:hypothetical protein S58_22150 [Bradyrhizobium oligotrophicum S58]|uniref:Uncharacterized protein n=1 Tax=Bradyrhizobium oligotrophicum S58 TaxID=1245469 RepID=M4Z5I7_9BRAD|nr:hypothetical protein S58_22150 [Bradyrhizobium oligotrophicum S58]